MIFRTPAPGELAPMRMKAASTGRRPMWSRNAFTERLNLTWPILQAPMGWLSTPALAAAVTNAGGLGGIGMWGFSAEDAERRIAGFRQQSAGSLNVNYPLWPEPRITAEASAAMRKRLALPRALIESHADDASRRLRAFGN
jgi:nitronate monooxygenase